MPLGILPQNPWHLLLILSPIIIWYVTLPLAKKHRILYFHDASLVVSFWEELLFRGIIFGFSLRILHNLAIAIMVSSVLFGFFHLRNLWWSSKSRVLYNCLYAGLIVGPILAVARITTGDIYLGILLHYSADFLAYYGPKALTKATPTDDYLASRRHNRNWFETLFSPNHPKLHHQTS